MMKNLSYLDKVYEIKYFSFDLDFNKYIIQLFINISHNKKHKSNAKKYSCISKMTIERFKGIIVSDQTLLFFSDFFLQL